MPVWVSLSERYGIDEVIANVPGAVDPTAAESAAYSCGDLTPTEVQAGQTTPTCGVTNGAAPPPPPWGSDRRHRQRQHGRGGKAIDRRDTARPAHRVERTGSGGEVVA